MPQRPQQFKPNGRSREQRQNIAPEANVKEFVDLADHHEAQAKHYERSARQLASDCRGSRALTVLKAEMHREFARALRTAIQQSAFADEALPDQGLPSAAEGIPADELSDGWSLAVPDLPAAGGVDP